MTSKRLRIALGLALLVAAAPAAAAERLSFDHRLSPPLKAAFDANDPARIVYNAKNPRYITDLVVVRGPSAQAWLEALLIIARAPDKKVGTAAAWADELRAESMRRCPSTFTVVAEDTHSILLERRSTGCPANYPPYALYRAVAGQKSLFLLAAMAKDELSPEAQAQYRAVLASARIE